MFIHAKYKIYFVDKTSVIYIYIYIYIYIITFILYLYFFSFIFQVKFFKFNCFLFNIFLKLNK